MTRDARLIERHCAPARDREIAMEAGERALGALWSMLDAC
jgi:hypothetical protein